MGALFASLAALSDDVALALVLADAMPQLFVFLRFLCGVWSRGVGVQLQHTGNANSLVTGAVQHTCETLRTLFRVGGNDTPGCISGSVVELIECIEMFWSVSLIVKPAIGALRHFLVSGGPTTALAAAERGAYRPILRALRRVSINSRDLGDHCEDILCLVLDIVRADAKAAVRLIEL